MIVFAEAGLTSAERAELAAWIEAEESYQAARLNVTGTRMQCMAEIGFETSDVKHVRAPFDTIRAPRGSEVPVVVSVATEDLMYAVFEQRPQAK